MSTDTGPASRSAPTQSGASPAWYDFNTALIGFAAGVLNGLIGIGGGIVIVPGLILRRKLDVRTAVSTSLGAILLLSVVSFALHVSVTGYSLSWTGSLLVIAAGIAGAQAGIFLLNRIPRRAVIVVFAGITLFTAVRLITQALGWAEAPAVQGTVPPWWAYPLLGSLSGLFSGLLGIGGGGYVVLGFSVFWHQPIQGSLPIALAMNVANALSGVWAQRRTGQVRWREIGRLVPAALAGIAIGTTLAVTLPADILRIIFGAFFAFMAGRLVAHAWRG